MSIRASPSLALFACAAITLGAQAADDIAAQRARIASERAAVDAKARAAEAACTGEFVVSTCVKAVRAERRAAMQQLDRQRMLLDDQQRKQRAAERLARVREKQDAVADTGVKPKVEVRTRSSATAGKAPERTPEQLQAEEERRASQVHAAASAAQQRDREAAQRAAASARRTKQAEEHRAAVEQRNRDRATEKPPAKPLPLPGAASAPK